LRLDRTWIEQHIPHSGRMCLLDEVQAWGEKWVRCRTATHRSLDNPLRAYGRLGAVCAIEYAAQAMAIHGALAASAAGIAARRGLLASVRDVQLHVDRLDEIAGDLVARAEQIAGDSGTALYEFSVSGGDRVLVSGRVAIAFNVSMGATASEQVT